jgi:GTP-binding protein
MKITSATFIKGIVAPDETLSESTFLQVAFIGRSNVGKSSVINTLAAQKGFAKTSSYPGSTQQINLFLINHKRYLVDLPGYGFARASAAGRARIKSLIDGYLFEWGYIQTKVVLIIDAYVGPTDTDREMLQQLEAAGKDIVIVANKVDKLKKSDVKRQLESIHQIVGPHRFIPYSAEKKVGIGELADEVLR